MIRIGHGFDLHRLVERRPLLLGGVHVPWERGLLGHSDADVLLHAVTDAVLGALALGDIGQWFPDTEEQYRNISSTVLLQNVLDSPELREWGLVNLDATILAEQPKLAPYLPQMREHIAGVFGVSVSAVSVKATTLEGLGELGRGQGIAAHAVIILREHRKHEDL